MTDQLPYTIQLRVTALERVATDAVKVTLSTPDHEPVPYQPGQYLTFLITMDHKAYRRSYSLVTTPDLDKDLAVVVKRQVNGEVSRYLYDHLRTGEILTALPPAGRFTLLSAPFEPQTLFFLAAGSGISPVFSLLKEALHHQPALHHTLIYQNHNEAATIFHNELLALQKMFPHRFTYLRLLSDPVVKQNDPQRLNNNLLEQLIAAHSFNHDRALFFVCGPEAFMRMASFVLRYLGFTDDQIRKENFVIHGVPAPPFMTDTAPKQITLHGHGQTHHFPVSYPGNILQAALDHGVYLPYSCRGGRCSACTVRCTSGLIRMSANEVLTSNDLEQGYRLTCVGYAETDLVLELA